MHVWLAEISEDDERAADWLAAYDILAAPVRSPIPEVVEIPERGPVAAYWLDLARLDDEEVHRVVEALSRRFGLPVAEVRVQVATAGVPILADGVTLSTCCGYVTGWEADGPLDDALLADLAGEWLAEHHADTRVTIELPSWQAWQLMAVLQLAIKHPGAQGQPLDIAIRTARELQQATCPPGSARERLALMGWAGRG